jgi:fatty-acyl-CoA synthase
MARTCRCPLAVDGAYERLGPNIELASLPAESPRPAGARERAVPWTFPRNPAVGRGAVGRRQRRIVWRAWINRTRPMSVRCGPRVRMPSHFSRRVAPTLVDAVRALERDSTRGFVFVRADGSERFCSFQEMASEAARRAGALASLGLREGDRLVLAVPESEEFVLSLLGASFAGIVPVPLHPAEAARSPAAYHQTVMHVVRAAGAAVILTTAAAKATIERAANCEGGENPLRAIVTVEDLAAVRRSLSIYASPGDLALIQFTSGSTARPKAIAVTHANLAANAAGFMIDGLRRDPSVDKGVSWLPLFHDMGLIGFVMGPLFTNVPCVILPTATFARRPRVWLETIHRHRGTITYASSFAYELIAKRLKDKNLQGLDLSSLRVCGCGAEPLQPKVLREFAETLAPTGFQASAFVPSYGMAEGTLAITLAPLGRGLETDTVDTLALAEGRVVPADSRVTTSEIVSCGRPLPEHELAIIDDDGRCLGERLVGQIVVRGPSVATGYFCEPEPTPPTHGPIQNDDPGDAPWLHTGDLGYLVGEDLFVCGRAQDIVALQGRNYFPTDIELAVGEVPGVRRGGVVAFSVPPADGSPAAGTARLVVCCEGPAAHEEAIMEQATAIVSARFGLTLSEVIVVAPASLPRTSSGKLKRQETRDAYAACSLVRVRTGVSAVREQDVQRA